MYEDGVELPCDAVVFATGYEVRFTAAPTQRCRCLLPNLFSRQNAIAAPLGQIAFPYLDPACGVTVVKNEVRRPPRRPRLIFSAFAF